MHGKGINYVLSKRACIIKVVLCGHIAKWEFKNNQNNYSPMFLKLVIVHCSNINVCNVVNYLNCSLTAAFWHWSWLVSDQLIGWLMNNWWPKNITAYLKYINWMSGFITYYAFFNSSSIVDDLLNGTINQLWSNNENNLFIVFVCHRQANSTDVLLSTDVEVFCPLPFH